MKTLQYWSYWLATVGFLIFALAVAGLIRHSLYEAKVKAWDKAVAGVLPLAGPIRSFPTNELKSVLEGGSEAVAYLLDRIEGTPLQRIATRYAGWLPILKRFAYAPDLSAQIDLPLIIEQMGGTARAHLPRMRRIFLAAPASRLNLLNAIGRIGRDDPETTRFLTRVGLDPTEPFYVRASCAGFLGTQSPSAAIVETLKRLYSDPAADVQEVACVALGKQGPVARSAIPLLAAALTNSNPQIRRAAVRSLAQIETNAAVIKPLVLPMAADTDKEVSWLAKRVLSEMSGAKN